MDDFDVVITIKGPGGVINYEAAIVAAALQMEGMKVHIVNDSPEENINTLINRRRSLRFLEPERVDAVKIVVDHQPWDG